MANIVRKGGGSKIGSVFKDEYSGSFIKTWMDFVDTSHLEKVELSGALGYFFSVKDATELDLCKRAAVLTNKIMKHGFVPEMESVLDNDVKRKHLDVSNKVCVL
jgi:nucleosome binding factor SPN SPT16 subunit